MKNTTWERGERNVNVQYSDRTGAHWNLCNFQVYAKKKTKAWCHTEWKLYLMDNFSIHTCTYKLSSIIQVPFTTSGHYVHWLGSFKDIPSTNCTLSTVLTSRKWRFSYLFSLSYLPLPLSLPLPPLSLSLPLRNQWQNQCYCTCTCMYDPKVLSIPLSHVLWNYSPISSVCTLTIDRKLTIGNQMFQTFWVPLHYWHWYSTIILTVTVYVYLLHCLVEPIELMNFLGFVS